MKPAGRDRIRNYSLARLRSESAKEKLRPGAGRATGLFLVGRDVPVAIELGREALPALSR